MAGRGRYDTTTGPLPLEPPRLLVALAIVALLGGLGAVFGRMAGSGRAVIAAGGSGGNSGGAGGGSNGSSSGSSGHSGGSNRNRSGTTPGAAPGRSAPNDGSSGLSNGSSGGSSGGGNKGGGGAPSTGPGATGGTGTTGPGPTGTAAPGPTTTLTPSQSTVPPNLPPGAAPTKEVACPANAPASPTGGRIRCYQVTGKVDGPVAVVGAPGIPVPLPVPVPIVVPVVHDTGASTFNSNDVDQRVTVYVDVDNRQVVDGEALGRAGQRVLATIALLAGLPLAVAATALFIRRRRGGPPPPASPAPPPAAPPPTPPPVPGPGGTWVWYPPGTSPPGVPPPEAPPPAPPSEPPA